MLIRSRLTLHAITRVCMVSQGMQNLGRFFGGANNTNTVPQPSPNKPDGAASVKKKEKKRRKKNGDKRLPKLFHILYFEEPQPEN